MNFWSSYVCKGVSHVKHMHADSLLIHPNFSSISMITLLNLLENPLLISFQTYRKFTFDPVWTNEGGSKVDFRTNWFRWPLISKRKSVGSKVNRHAFASRDYLLHKHEWIKISTAPWLASTYLEFNKKYSHFGHFSNFHAFVYDSIRLII